MTAIRRFTLAILLVTPGLLAVTTPPSHAQGFALGWGSFGSGPGLFNHPAGLAVDASGNVYVADTGNRRIQKFDANGNFISEISVSPDFPNDVAVDPSGKLYVTVGGQVLVLDSNGSSIDAWPNAASGAISLAGAFGIARGPDGSIYVTRLGNSGPPPVVFRFGTAGNVMNSWGALGSAHGEFQKLLYMTVDASGTVYVVDNGNGRIEQFSATGTYQATFGAAASSSIENACGKFIGVYGVAVNSAGDVLATDNTSFDHVHVFSPAGACMMSWGPYGTGASQFSTIGDVAVGPGDALYVVDTGNNRVQKFTSPVVDAAPTSWGAVKSIYRR